MFLSVFDMFKVGIGPSSSHTIGPMVAATRFLDQLRAQPFKIAGLKASLHGSLAFTGVGHATDRAVILGLSGMSLDTYDMAAAEAEMARIKAEETVTPDGFDTLRFNPKEDLLFDYGPRTARSCQWDDPACDGRPRRYHHQPDLLLYWRRVCSDRRRVGGREKRR